MIGQQTGNCVAYGLINTDCRKCLFDPIRLNHECKNKFEGSSKAMESALAIDMTRNLREKGYSISSLTMDDDTTTIARLHTSVDKNINKISDKNHVKKNISKELFKLRDKHRTLSTKIIDYIIKDISYAISQNKGNVEGLQHSLDAIVPHSFGDHSSCKDSWCGYLKNPEQYVHKSLPYGRDLSDENLRKDLSELLVSYRNNAKKLANLGSTQANESLNQLIATKAPKFKHFGGSSSLENRVAAAVSQKNEGRKYVHQVLTEHGLSPGKFTVHHSKKLDKKRSAERDNEMTKSFKKRRLMKKRSRSTQLKCKETREGDEYKTAIDMSSNFNSPDIELVPSNLEKPICNHVNCNDTTPLVIFDLETTGFGKLSLSLSRIHTHTRARFL